MTAQIHETPGHSQDSLSVYERGSKLLITGDVIPQWDDLPIYNDYPRLRRSLQFLQGFTECEWLLSSWSEPIQGSAAVAKSIADGLNYIETIDTEIKGITEPEILGDAMALCRTVVEGLGFPAFFVNPLVAKSFASHVGDA